MSFIRAGETYNLSSNVDILMINSPEPQNGNLGVTGPYVVVAKSISDRWAIVALDWDSNPSLGIRWFYGKGGTPYTRSSAWFIIPPLFYTAVLGTLKLNPQSQTLIDQYLGGTITGSTLSTSDFKEVSI